MTGMPRRPIYSDRMLHRTAWSLAVTSVAVTIAGLGLALLGGLSSGVGLLAPMSIVGIGYGIIGARVVDVRPRNPVGWLLIGIALSWGFVSTCYQFAELAQSQPAGQVAGATLAAWLFTWLWVPGGAALLVFMPLLFPTGHLLSLRWHRFAVFMAIFVTFDTIAHAGASLQHVDDLAALLAYKPQDDPSVMGALVRLGDFMWFGSLVAIAAVFIRLRRSTGLERQQLRWYGIAIMIAAVAVIVMGVLELDLTVGLTIATSVIPVSIGVAMLRYRLYELDRLVSRTIAYAVVTGLLVATYAGLILLLEGPLGSAAGGETIPVALSTLAVATLFTPVRRRVQRIVDRRFDRARYDAEGMTAAFSERLRNEMDLGAVTTDLDGTVRRAMAPTVMHVWLREGQR